MKIRSLCAKAVLAASLLLPPATCPAPAQAGAGDPLCVTNLQAEDSGSGNIRLSWSLPEGPSKGKVLFFAVYRDQHPIYSSTRLRSLFPIAAVPKSHISYVDEADSGTGYYYAVLTFVDQKEEEEGYQDLYYDEDLDGPESRAEEDSGMLYTVILPGINATIAPVKIGSLPADPQTKKILPGSGPQAGGGLSEEERRANAQQLRDAAFLKEAEETLHKERSILPATERLAADLQSPAQARAKRRRPLFRHIFSEDQVVPAGGDEYLLYEILQKSWLPSRYEDAKRSLTAFLSQNRDEAPAKRAAFYLAEAEYYLGNYGEALNLFVAVQDSFPQLAGKWIDSCLDLYGGR